jgi:hypothetical protein
MESNLVTRNWVFILIIVICSMGALTIIYSTNHGPGIGSDSVGYIEAARNLLAGRGLVLPRASGRFAPPSFHPPLYSLLLGSMKSLGVEFLITARWLNIILYFIFGLVVGLGSYFFYRRELFSISVVGVILSTPIMISNFSSAMSEPLYFVFGFSGLFLLLLYFRNENRVTLFLSAIIISLSFLSRYSGAALISAAVMGLWILNPKPIRQRILDSVYFLGIGILPMIVWLLIQRFGYPNSEPGVFDFRLFDLWDKLNPVRLSYVDIMWNWLPFSSYLPSLSYRSKLIIFLGLVFLLFAWVLFAIVKVRRRMEGTVLRNPLIQFGLLFGFVFVAHSLLIAGSYVVVVSPKPALNDRILSTLFIAALLSLFAFLYFTVEVWPSKRWIQSLSLFLSSAILCSNILLSFARVTELHQNGEGYTNIRWQSSGVMEEVMNLPADISLISNIPTAILFYANRPAYEIPEIADGLPREEFQPFGDEEEDGVERRFREEGAALILFQEIYWQLRPIYQEGTEERLEALTQGLRLYYEGWDGAIYFYE